MPIIKAGDINLYYEIHGTGRPLVLIRGFGSNSAHWNHQVPEFSRRFQTLVFDNRGIGRSDKPDYPYTISMLAGDVANLLDALGLDRVFLLGLSMGGMIAQRFALDYPDRLAGLVLAATHCGGAHAVQPSEKIKKTMTDLVMGVSPDEAVKMSRELMFTEDTERDRPELLKEYLELSQRYPNDLKMLLNQLAALNGHDAHEDLPRLKTPTLVLTGDQDALVPPENATILADRIPGARLTVIEGGAHQFLVEQDRAFNQAVIAFLTALDG
ncbi:MAG: alpha/beta fold hydrolase [Pseudomonadota bacterium]